MRKNTETVIYYPIEFTRIKSLEHPTSGLNLLLLVVISLGFCSLSAFGQNTAQVIYDGRTEFKAVLPSLVEKQLIKGEVKRKEVQIKGKSSLSCDEDTFGINDFASGSFTRPNSAQKAVLYEFCRSGRSFGIGGIVIIENGRVVAHYTYGDNGLDYGIKSLPDIDQNGLSEIMLIGGGTGQGYTEGGVEIIELGAKEVKFLGNIQTYNDNFGAGTKPVRATAYKILTQSDATPIFYRETYRKNGDSMKWILIKKMQKFLLEKDTVPTYHKID